MKLYEETFGEFGETKKLTRPHYYAILAYICLESTLLELGREPTAFSTARRFAHCMLFLALARVWLRATPLLTTRCASARLPLPLVPPPIA